MRLSVSGQSSEHIFPAFVFELPIEAKFFESPKSFFGYPAPAPKFALISHPTA
jgi:hypothetical protein